MKRRCLEPLVEPPILLQRAPQKQRHDAFFVQTRRRQSGVERLREGLPVNCLHFPEHTLGCGCPITDIHPHPNQNLSPSLDFHFLPCCTQFARMLGIFQFFVINGVLVFCAQSQQTLTPFPIPAQSLERPNKDVLGNAPAFLQPRQETRSLVTSLFSTLHES